MLAGLGIQFSPINPMKALFWSAVINGIVAAVIVTPVSKPSVMGTFTASRAIVVLGWIATFLMGLAVVLMFLPF